MTSPLSELVGADEVKNAGVIILLGALPAQIGSASGADRKIDNIRAYSLAQVAVCKGCHEDKFKQYEGSIHASLLRAGNPIAPVCTDCHNPHAVRLKAARASLTEIPCQKCHSSIFSRRSLAAGSSPTSRILRALLMPILLRG